MVPRGNKPVPDSIVEIVRGNPMLEEIVQNNRIENDTERERSMREFLLFYL